MSSGGLVEWIPRDQGQNTGRRKRAERPRTASLPARSAVVMPPARSSGDQSAGKRHHTPLILLQSAVTSVTTHSVIQTSPTHRQPRKHYGIGAVDSHPGQTVVRIRRRKRRRETAELLDALLATHPTGTIYVA